MERDGNTNFSNSQNASLRQKVKDREGEIGEWYREIADKKREIADLRSQLHDDGEDINEEGGVFENMNTPGSTGNLTLNINPGSSDIHNQEENELRQEVVVSYS